jgi:zinc transporter 1
MSEFRDATFRTLSLCTHGRSNLDKPCIFTALKSGRILLEAVPLYVDLVKVKEDLLAVRMFSILNRDRENINILLHFLAISTLKIPDVLSVHDLHVWHLSQSCVVPHLRT